MADLSEILQQVLQTSQINSEILASLILLSIVAAIGWLAFIFFGRYFSRIAQKTNTAVDDAILSAVKVIIIIMISIFGIEYALSPLSLLQPYSETLNGIFIVLQIFLGAFAVTRVSNILVDWYAGRKTLVPQKNNYHLLFLLKKIIQVLVFVFAFLIILYVFDVNLTGAVLGLGVGGIAIAFAVQNQLGDVLGAFTIYFDRPFEIGDFIIVGNYSGTVTNIGVKSTRIKLLQGEELVISNKELTSASVRNFRRLEKRRVAFNVGVTYDTPLEKLKRIPLMITGIINNIENATVDRVNFTEFGDYSLKFFVIYYVNSSEYGKYLDTQEKINFAILEAFEKESIEIAFPTSTVNIKK